MKNKIINNSEINNQLNIFKKEEELLKKHKNKSFKTKEEGEKYIEENELELTRLNELNIF